MSDAWRQKDHDVPLTGAAAVELLCERVVQGALETWFETDGGRMLAFVTNRARAMVVLMDEVGDAGEHATDPSAGETESHGFVLSNGQHDSYPDRETLPIDLALVAVAETIDGVVPTSATWVSDR